MPAVAVVPLDEGEDVGAGLLSGRPDGRPDLGLEGREPALRDGIVGGMTRPVPSRLAGPGRSGRRETPWRCTGCRSGRSPDQLAGGAIYHANRYSQPWRVGRQVMSPTILIPGHHGGERAANQVRRRRRQLVLFGQPAPLAPVHPGVTRGHCPSHILGSGTASTPARQTPLVRMKGVP